MPSDEQEVIALLIEEAGRIKVFVDPEWRNVVGSADRQYIDDILSDFVECATCDPTQGANPVG